METPRNDECHKGPYSNRGAPMKRKLEEAGLEEKPLVPKRLKFEDAPGGTCKNTDEKGITRIIYTLSSEDKKYVENLHEHNDKKIADFKMSSPSMKIVSYKYAHTSCDFNTGNSYVTLRKYPFKDSNDKTTELVLDSFEFGELQPKLGQIMRFIYALEGKQLDSEGKQMSPFDFLKPNTAYLNKWKEWKQMKIFVTDSIKITLKWNELSKETKVDIRRGEDTLSTDGKTTYWKGGNEGFCLCGGGFEIFYEEILPKLCNHIRFWSNIWKAGRDTWRAFYSSYEPRHEYFNWDKRFSWFMPVEDEQLHGDYETRAEARAAARGDEENAQSAWRIVEEDGLVYHSN